MTFDDTDWINGFDSWEEVWTLLQDDWVRIDDDERLRLDRDGDELSWSRSTGVYVPGSGVTCTGWASGRSRRYE